MAKEDNACFPAGTPVADQRNMVFMNTVATRGRGEIAVTATGVATAIGRLSHELAEAREPRSPLQQQLDAAGKRLGLIALALKRFPPDLNRRDSQRVKDERIFVH